MSRNPSFSDATLSTISRSDDLDDDGAVVADELVLLLDCDHPDSGSTRHRLEGVDEVRIGRGASRTVERAGRMLVLKLPDPRVSTAHASLVREGAAFVLHDAGSKNGILVNGSRVSSQLLRDGDIVECGRTFLRYRVAVARPRGEPLDVDAAATPDVDLRTHYEPLARQLRTLAQIARSNLPVLILGASGTGKEVVARALHAMSERKGAFVGVNCGALPETLVEAELFGARRGAFTGATEERVGLVRTSHQGTLFLDEVAELPTRAQPTLLRTLQEHEVLAIGATKPVPVDMRLVTATHRNLEELVDREQFRGDLLARISGVVLRLPTLRERIDDFGLLVASLLARHGEGRALPTIAPDALRLMLRHPWPLNIRELEHALRAALTLSPTRIEVAHLPAALRTPTAATPAVATPRPTRRLTPEQEARRAEVEAMLTECHGNVSEVARRMGKDRVQIRRWIRMFGLSRDEPID